MFSKSESKTFLSAQLILILATTDNSIFRSTLFDPFSSDARSKARKFSSHEQRAQAKGPATGSFGNCLIVGLSYPYNLRISSEDRSQIPTLSAWIVFLGRSPHPSPLVRSFSCLPRHCSFFFYWRMANIDLIFIDFYAYSYLFCSNIRLLYFYTMQWLSIPYTDKVRTTVLRKITVD